ncbi:epoxyqueuosine reductase [Cobetia marina]|nr:epoxyqueuosine reductase [Cobetia marina]
MPLPADAAGSSPDETSGDDSRVADPQAMAELAARIKTWGRELGFQQVGITDVDLSEHEAYLERWLANGHHGEMNFMAKHGTKRTRPEELVPGTLRVISVRLDYLPPEVETTQVLSQPERAYVSRYALGRDYHKLMRKRLANLAKQIEKEVGTFGYRAFVDSAPVMERALAQKAGIGWFGKNAMLMNQQAGCLFFLGELYTDLPLPVDAPFEKEHCGSCNACKVACPTDAIVEDKVIDARRCISYLTIELDGAIPEEFRRAMGNRIYGCDDCQLFCPFTRFAKATQEADFSPRHDLDRIELIRLFCWGEQEFLDKTQGSPIRRIGYEKWLSNIAIGLGNAPWSEQVEHVLRARLPYPSEPLREHVRWALKEQAIKRGARLATAL